VTLINQLAMKGLTHKYAHCTVTLRTKNLEGNHPHNSVHNVDNNMIEDPWTGNMETLEHILKSNEIILQLKEFSIY